MTANEFFRKLMSGKFWANIGAMLIVVVLLCLGVKFGLDVYTHHGESIAIPDVRRKSFADADYLLREAGMTVVVSDTGYVRGLPPDCILEQSPAPGECVKSGHVIYLTVNASHTPTLTVPDIIDNSSLREAMAKLQAMGFKLTHPMFVEGEKDWVYGLVVHGRQVKAGDRIGIDDFITIQVGNGQRDSTEEIDYTDAPELLPEEQMEEVGDVDEFQEIHE